jgi:hypothetical protein
VRPPTAYQRLAPQNAVLPAGEQRLPTNGMLATLFALLAQNDVFYPPEVIKQLLERACATIVAYQPKTQERLTRLRSLRVGLILNLFAMFVNVI